MKPSITSRHGIGGERAANFFHLRSLFLLIPVLFAGCGLFFGSPPPDEQYTLDYASPPFESLSRLSSSIRVDRFVTAEQFSNTTMISSPSQNKRAVYNNAWWDVNPGEMITDVLLRDIRNSGLYQATFSYRDDGEARFVLKGSVDEFLEVDSNEKAQAVLSLTVTLVDSAQKIRTGSIVYQKNYHATVPIANRSPQALASGLSTTMAELSKQLQKDVYDAVRPLCNPAAP